MRAVETFYNGRNRERAIWVAGIAFALVQTALLSRAYRITADDVAFFQFGLQGWEASLEATRLTAEGQGRIGAFIIIPINIFSALLSDHIAFRVFSATLYLLHFFLFSLWTQMVVGHRIAAPIFLMLVAFNVTDFLHLPPISYPLQNTIPFLLIIASRLYLFGSSRVLNFRGALSLLAFGVGVIATEYGFLLGTAMLCCEWFKQVRGGMSFGGLSKSLLSSRVLPSVAVLMATLAMYAGWRYAFPSKYDGNQLAPLPELHRGLMTAFWHVISLYLLPYLDTFKTLPYSPLEPRPLSWLSWVGAAVYGMLAGIALYMSRDSFLRIRSPLPIAVVAVVLGIYMVLPVALTEKHQSGCLNHRVCTFLDSQLAYLAITVVWAMLATWFISSSRGERSKMRYAVAVAVFASVHAVIVFIANQRVIDTMDRVTDVWEMAKITVCRNDLPQDALAKVFDPTNLLSMHPGFDREAFWKIYRDVRGARCSG